jgi:hypothetical protein
MKHRWVYLLALFLVSCATPIAPRATVTRAQCMATAESYATHRWFPTTANVRHGVDRSGIRVDTPDRSYQKPGAVAGWWTPQAWNVSIPYQWGGFATLAEFDRAVASGHAAGDVYTSEKRRLLDAAVSAEATGIDCSGLISRCWNLPRSYSTRELPNLCEPLPSWDDLRPGDILNTYNAHVFLFAGWSDAARSKLVAYESGRPPHWKCVRTTLARATLQQQGFQPWRYRGMAD